MSSPRRSAGAMPRLEWHPLLSEWVVVTPARQARPVGAKKVCPFCPGSGKVPRSFGVYFYPNDFPAFDFRAGSFRPDERTRSRRTAAEGLCEVVLYGPEHKGSLGTLPLARVREIVDAWAHRTAELATDSRIACVYPFENRGTEIGVTIPHPHGQLYAAPFLPPRLAAEWKSFCAGPCPLCAEVRAERRGPRVVDRAPGWLAVVPRFARYPYEVQLWPTRHRALLPELSESERAGLAAILRRTVARYDRRFGKPLPYMMVIHQAPTRERARNRFHLHFEFYVLQRSETQKKYLAGFESGAGTFLLDLEPEEAARQLRRV